MERILNLPCQVCAVTSTKGEVTPLWCRYQDEEGEIQKLVIDEVKRTNGFHGINTEIYECTSHNEIQKTIFHLLCDFASHKWCIVKQIV